MMEYNLQMPITVAARYKAGIVFVPRTLGSWVGIPVETSMSACVYFVFVLFCYR
jgi:hypothetical protein